MLIWKDIKRLFYRYIPSHINDPVGLIRRLLFSSNRAGRFALFSSGLGVVFTPIDWVVSKFEGLNKPSGESSNNNIDGPHIFICGPARSGTTLLYQVLANNLPLSYTRNLALLFPRSKRTATKLSSLLFRTKRKGAHREYQNYYGKTFGFSAPSEANFLWNQWVEADASEFRTILTDSEALKVANYYRHLSDSTGLPTLAKNNNANVFARTIFNALPNSYFICLKRDSLYLAQSLIRARIEINGNVTQSYGVVDTENNTNDSNPYNQVLNQIGYLNNAAKQQQDVIGSDRFWIINYEDFCANPTNLINRIRTEILKKQHIENKIPPFANSNKIVDEHIFAAVKKAQLARAASTRNQADRVPT